MKILIQTFREKNPDFVSRGIMWKTKADCSHIAFVYDDIESGRRMMSHAIGKGVCTQDYVEYLNDHIVVQSLEIDLPISYDQWQYYLLGAEGKDYAESQYGWFIAPKFLKPLAKKLFFDGARDFVCSEWITYNLELHGKFKFDRGHEEWEPDEVIPYLKASL